MFLNTYTLQFNLSGGFHGNDYDVEIMLAEGLKVTYPSGGALDAIAGSISGKGFGGSEISPKINVLCKNVNLPGKSLSTTEVFYQGKKFIVSGEQEFSGTIELEYYNDRELTTRRFFLNWLNNISSADSDFYQSTMIITPKTKKAIVDIVGSTELEHHFIGVYPTNISDLSLDGTNVSELTTSTITLAYSFYTTKEDVDGIAGAIKSGGLGGLF